MAEPPDGALRSGPGLESQSYAKNNMQALSLRWQTWVARQTHPRASEPPLRAELFAKTGIRTVCPTADARELLHEAVLSCQVPGR